MATPNYTSNDVERFWTKVAITADDEKCWEYLKRRDKNGYGRFWFNGKQRGAHRFAWMITNGELDDKILVLHTCDNPSCVNPKHLFIGTHLDNMRDMTNKGRRDNEMNPHCKLSNQEVIEIRSNYANGNTLASLARKYNVSTTAIGYIVHNKSRKGI